MMNEFGHFTLNENNQKTYDYNPTNNYFYSRTVY